MFPSPASYRFRLCPLAAAALAALAALNSSVASAQSSAPTEVVEVVGSTPLGGSVRTSQMAAPVQRATDADLQRGASGDVSEFMSRRLGSVHVNNVQGNPLQMDVSFRGYTASPLLGTPQGLSVYLDGVRLNQPFGDVVSWDLIPSSAIAGLQLIPGSNPLFGLNTLGGALSLQTKDGHSHPGGAVQLSLASHQRLQATGEVGGVLASGWDYFATVNQLQDVGWRVNSPSDVTQGFAKLGWRDGTTQAHVTAAAAQSTLNGNGLQEQRFLARDWASVYTQPDTTHQSSALLNLSVDHALGAGSQLRAHVYARQIRGSSLNADINEGALDQSVYQPSAAERNALAAAGYSGFPTSGATAANTPFPFWRCIANALLQDEPGEKCNGLINTTATTQRTLGAQAQWNLQGQVWGFQHQALLGAGWERSRVQFRQDTQLGYLNPDRTVTGVDAVADGLHAGNVDGEPLDLRVDLRANTQTISLFANDTVTLAEGWHLNLAGRFNQSRISNRDQIVSAPDPSSLDGEHRFSRLNPALGLTWNPSRQFGAYLGLAGSSRAPTAIELGCANPDKPCKLPNAMAGDPPLRQVLTRTWELGARGHWAPDSTWRAGVFRADNRDDILFVADEQSGYGYFKNFGRTRRQGLELGLESRSGAVTWGLSYTGLDATYQSAETVLGAANSSNDAGEGLEGNIQILPGHRIPLVPRHILKAQLGWVITPHWQLDLDAVGMGGSFARGNENNQHQPDGERYLGSGRSAGYGLMNLGLTWQPTPQLKFFTQINNLFDRRYTTAAQLGATGFNDAGQFVARPLPAINGAYPLVNATFYAPGAPRSLMLGVRWNWE